MTRSKKHRILTASCILAVSLFAASSQTDSSGANSLARDLALIKKRVLAPYRNDAVNTRTVTQLLTTLSSQGSWPDIDYKNKRRSSWLTRRHLSQVSTLVKAYAQKDSALYGDAKLKKAIDRSLDFWLRNDFRNPNWWHNVIGVPQTLAPILLLLDKELSDLQKQKGIEILKRSKLGMTGQNLIWVAGITVMRGVLQNDPDVIHKAFERIKKEIRCSRGEGIQHDFSFHQHGPCLYNHGYGAGFAVDCPRLAAIVSGTQFAFPQEKIDLLASYILDGSQWLARGETEDYGADGREIARRGQTARYLQSAAHHLLQLPTGRDHELKELAGRIKGTSRTHLEGNRHFWCSDIMVHHRQHYYTSARMYSDRLVNTDMPCNGEAMKNHYIADGCNYLLRTGREYNDIFPVWDWEKIPGTTVESKGAFSGSPRRKGESSFAGGVSDGRYGAAAFILKRKELSAHKSWFFFDDAYLCLGSGITSATGNPVFTTVNQCRLEGDVQVFRTSTKDTLTRGAHRFTDLAAAWHDRVGYIFLNKIPAAIKNTAHEGSWKTINTAYPATTITHDIFTLWIDHGASPRAARYAYLVAPGIGQQEVAGRLRRPGLQILENSTDLQAVYHHKLGLLQAAFYSKGSVRLPSGLTITSHQDCLFMLERKGASLAAAASDPRQRKESITITLEGRYRGKGCSIPSRTNTTEIRFTLPRGGMTGRTVLKELTPLP